MVESYSVILLLRWLLPLWLMGWLMLPLSRRIFPNFPDGGLAAGRFLCLLLLSLLTFWLVSLHWISLAWSPLWVLGAPVLCGLTFLYYLAGRPEYRLQELRWLRHHRRVLFCSDAVFLLTFLFFAWLRACNPAINEFEKPMDSAIIGVLSRSQFLPAENPWFAGEKFTNYYYFGHFMGSLLKRSLHTPLPYAYNLIHPAFCAFFVSILWSLCAALCGSVRRGSLAMLIVAFCAHLEPLRQWFFSKEPALNKSTSFPYLDWWSTSRVIPNTINEYPFFTMALGDAHAHFFALSIAALLFCTSYQWLASAIARPHPPEKTLLSLTTHKSTLLCLLGLQLGAIIMCNSWDYPLYALLTGLCIWTSIGRSVVAQPDNVPDTANKEQSTLVARMGLVSIPAFISAMASSPYLAQYRSQIGGVRYELWWPSWSFLWLWGGFLLLGIYSSLRFYLKIKATQTTQGLPNSDQRARKSFIAFLAGCGLIALFFPFVSYIEGHFGGELRHQDTVFKFGLQAWLLLGTGIVCSALSIRESQGARLHPPNNPSLALTALRLGAIIIWIPPVLGSLSVLQAKSARVPNPSNQVYAPIYSLNGAAYLSVEEQKALRWLELNAPPDAIVVEPVGRDAKGNFIAAYGSYGRVAALTGVASYIGWPQHAGFWGVGHHKIQKRLIETETLFNHNLVFPAMMPGFFRPLISVHTQVGDFYIFTNKAETTLSPAHAFLHDIPPPQGYKFSHVFSNAEIDILLFIKNKDD